jgi:Flp pilus assembly protein TadG
MAARRGAVTLEFAMVGSVLIILTLAVFGAGMAFWVITGLQSAAGTAARCGAIGQDATATCATIDQTNTHARSLASDRAGSGVVATADVVSSVSGATTCNGFTGKFYTVSISSSWFTSGALAFVVAPFNLTIITVSSCFPMA